MLKQHSSPCCNHCVCCWPLCSCCPTKSLGRLVFVKLLCFGKINGHSIHFLSFTSTMLHILSVCNEHRGTSTTPPNPRSSLSPSSPPSALRRTLTHLSRSTARPSHSLHSLSSEVYIVYNPHFVYVAFMHSKSGMSCLRFSRAGLAGLGLVSAVHSAFLIMPSSLSWDELGTWEGRNGREMGESVKWKGGNVKYRRC